MVFNPSLNPTVLLRKLERSIEKERGFYSTWDDRKFYEDIIMESREPQGAHAGGGVVDSLEICLVKGL